MSEHSYQLIIFDMDGTLVDTEPLYADSLRTTCRERGLELSEAAAHEYTFGKSWNSIYADVQKAFPDSFTSVDDLRESACVFFNEFIQSKDVAIPESVALLKEMAQSLPVCIVSGSSRDHIAHFVKLLQIEQAVKFFIGSDDYDGGKPEPDCFLLAAQQENVAVENCLIFEDSAAGIEAAARAGIDCVALNRSDNQPVKLATLTLQTLADFNYNLLSRSHRRSHS